MCSASSSTHSTQTSFNFVVAADLSIPAWIQQAEKANGHDVFSRALQPLPCHPEKQ